MQDPSLTLGMTPGASYACLALITAGLMASYFPAKRVTEIDPVETLRGE